MPPDQPITVSIGVDIKDIPKVSDTDFTITLNAYFIVKWQDSRLVVNDLIKATNNKTGHRKEQQEQELTALNLAILSTLWLPDVEIRSVARHVTHLAPPGTVTV